MLNNVALDVCIGLIFIYLLYSLLATIIQEMVAQWLSLRPRMLMKGLRNMLEDRKVDLPDSVRTNSVFSYLFTCFQRFWTSAAENWSRFKCPLPEDTVSKAFYQHPGIKYLTESSWNSKPAYIKSSSFSNTMIQLLRGEKYDGVISQIVHIQNTLFEKKAIQANGVTYNIDAETLKFLQQLFIDAQRDVDRFRSLLEKWYDDTMERVGGWYKRQTQLILFIIGLVMAIIFNADSIAITNILAKDKTARENLVQLAINSKSRYDTLTQKVASTKSIEDSSKKTDTFTRTVNLTDKELQDAYRLTLSDIDNANHILGLGWHYKDTSAGMRILIDSIMHSNIPVSQQALIVQTLLDSKANNDDCQPRKFLQFHPLQAGGIFTIAGWLITALAVCMGAPFWFDLLNKVIRLRSAGVKPATDDKSNSTGKTTLGNVPVLPASIPQEQLKITDRKG
jgi:hypothetical protein